jgi:hypothetical protein
MSVHPLPIKIKIVFLYQKVIQTTYINATAALFSANQRRQLAD